MALDQDNKLLIPILTGSETSYSYSTSSAVSDEPHVKGLRTTLVAGVQTKKGARVTFVGSLELLSNKFFDAASYGNRDFAAELSKWSFQERGFLRHRGVFHTNKGGKSTPENYRVGEDLEYSVVIEEWNGEKWAPFVADDIQLEFTMLDPYIRTKLTHAGDGKYVASFRVPDVYGVYKFSVDYRRTGYSILSFFDNVIIRPMRLNEYERYIEAAYPYYASAFSVIVGFAIFSFFFIYMAEGEKRKAE
jgi:oligosaccharyltransferase complex subunit beta